MGYAKIQCHCGKRGEIYTGYKWQRGWYDPASAQTPCTYVDVSAVNGTFGLEQGLAVVNEVNT